MLRTRRSSSQTQLCSSAARTSAPASPESRRKDGLGRDHPRFHRGMAALDLRHVEKSGGVADQRAAREIEPRDRLKAALVERPRAIGDASAALEKGADRRVRLEALELLERVQKRVLVIEPDDKPDRHLAVFEVIEKRAAIGGGVERPADGVDDEAGLVPVGRDLPQFLDADRVGLRVDAVAQTEALRPASWSASRGSLRRTASRGAISSTPGW